jgi:hypothetical protein
MSWQAILQNDSNPSEPLRQRIDALFTQQRDTWPAFRDGELALAELHRKTLRLDGDSVIVQVNPARRASTFAKTDANAVAARPCFLCPANMPAEERGAAFEDLVVLPNPFPILPLHCTIAARDHRPQQIAGQVGAFVRLARSLGPDMAALYNGPRCGASAPDHFHFQAAAAQEIPILRQIHDVADDRSIASYPSFGRNMIVVRSSNAANVEQGIERTIEALRRHSSTSDEPMMNLLGQFEAGRYTAVIFPRAAHRPACYFATGDQQLAISPAVLEMGGILVTTESDHFERIDAADARKIYEEVSISKDLCERVAAEVG